MIIGNGFIANKFKPFYNSNENICIYASGISNPNCLAINEFERESNFLLSCLKNYKNHSLFVYFGSVYSDYNIEKINSPYMTHKKKMEYLVSQHQNYLILRLPTVAGCCNNNNTLLKFLFLSILNNKKINIFNYAYRDIIDIDDIVKITNFFIKSGKFSNRILNISSFRKYSVLEIVNRIEKITNIQADYFFSNTGFDFQIYAPELLYYLNYIDVNFNELYLDKVLKKQYSDLMNIF